MDIRQQLEQSIGNTYAIERELGGGGMSRVFVAEERRLNRKVVIKVLSPELAAGVSSERFEREIQLAASMQQANIVPILSAGDANGLPYFTMPFVDGESLRARLARDTRLPASTVINVLRDVAKALAYAHERGVVHRDIKPDNVLLSGGTAVVTDFGIAKAISAAREVQEGGTLTQFGTSLGTPAYMSPEQAAGDPDVDHRADIYSLGATAYELLTGRSPFQGLSAARMLAAHIAEKPAPVTDGAPDTPAPLAALVMQCLEKDPARRPASGADVVARLEGMMHGTISGAESATAPGRAGPGLTAIGVAFVAALVVARASVVAFGLPDWFFLGAAVALVLALAFMLWQRHAGKGARRAWTGAAVVLGGYALLVAGFMTLRALGIGPAGSLRAAGKLGDRERLIVTDFPSPDSSLAGIATEAVRTTLGQSRVISLLPASAIAAALQRMQQPPASRIDLTLARDIAQREGVKVIIDGAIRALGTGYVVTLRLVSSDSGNTLAQYQETADGPRELLTAIDGIARKLRRKIGESLREVRDSPPLDQVTTSSLEALRRYAAASRLLDVGGSPIEAAAQLREVVKIDTTFAMAYRKLGVALSNSGLPRAQVDSALESAYRFRDRLTDRERLLTEGTYFQLGPGRDRRQAIRAYEGVLAIDPNDVGAGNNLASILSGRRDFARAESVFKSFIAGGRATSSQYTNLIAVLFNGGKVDEAERLAAEYRQRFPTATYHATSPASFLYHRGQYDSLDALYAGLAKSDNVILRLNGLGGMANEALLHGRVEETLRLSTQAQRLAQTLGQPANPVGDSIQMAFVTLGFYDDTVGARRRIESLVARPDIERMPFDQRPYLALASFYAATGDARQARVYLAKYEAGLTDSTMRRTRENNIRAITGAIEASEGRYQDAVRDLWRADTTYDGPDGNCSICILDDIGWVWDRGGEPDSAIAYFEKYLNTPYIGRQQFEAGPRPLLIKRLGELYESKGDVVNAAKRYREFLALWTKADPKLQPKVEDVKYRLSRLANVEKR